MCYHLKGFLLSRLWQQCFYIELLSDSFALESDFGLKFFCLVFPKTKKMGNFMIKLARNLLEDKANCNLSRVKKDFFEKY